MNVNAQATRELDVACTHCPAQIKKLPPEWQDLWASLPPLAGYADIAPALGFRSTKGLGQTMSSDPDAPRGSYIARRIMFPRAEVVLWAHARAQRSSGRYSERNSKQN